MRPPNDDRGFVTIAVAGLLLMLLSVTALVATLGAVAVARHRAAAAADLAALAAASRALEGSGAACQAAATVARRQSAHLLSCSISGLEALVVVGVRPPGRIGLLGEARATSRAGPKP